MKHRSRFKFPGAGIELHADIRGDHGPEDGDVLSAVHAYKNEDQRIGFAARRNSSAQQEADCSNENSSHISLRVRQKRSALAGAQHAAPLPATLSRVTSYESRLISSRWAAPACRGMRRCAA